MRSLGVLTMLLLLGATAGAQTSSQATQVVKFAVKRAVEPAKVIPALLVSRAPELQMDLAAGFGDRLKSLRKVTVAVSASSSVEISTPTEMRDHASAAPNMRSGDRTFPVVDGRRGPAINDEQLLFTFTD